ncbi:hypothetical protein KY289_001239 [Solanum tuberosum]|nr:hypothetical protein KY289_001239 [Solanum tuberosum]
MHTCDPMRYIGEFLTKEGWDFDALQDALPVYVMEHIKFNMFFVQPSEHGDKPWWTKSSTGKFSVKTSWELLRQKSDKNEDLKLLWIKGLPFKFSFLGWRIWNGKVPVAGLMHLWNPTISQNCKCCSILVEETIQHLFLIGEVSIRVWDHYFRSAGLLGSMLNLKQTIRRWWFSKGSYRTQVIFQVVPIAILWCLWKRRNIIRHDGSFSKSKVIWEINDIVLKVIKTRFKRDIRRNNWLDIITDLQGGTTSTVKCNTDGASRGNPGPSSATFCIRDYSGSLVVAKGFKIQDTSNLVAEARAIRKGLVFCKEHLLSHVIIETDSMAMVQILDGVWDIPWSVTMEVNSINCLRRSLSARVQHTFGKEILLLIILLT